MTVDDWTVLAVLVVIVLMQEFSYRQGVKHGRERERDGR